MSAVTGKSRGTRYRHLFVQGIKLLERHSNKTSVSPTMQCISHLLPTHIMQLCAQSSGPCLPLHHKLQGTWLMLVHGSSHPFGTSTARTFNNHSSADNKQRVRWPTAGVASLGALSCCHLTQQWPKRGHPELIRNCTKPRLFRSSLPAHGHKPLRQRQSLMAANALLLGKSGFFHAPPEQLRHLHRETDGVATNASARQRGGHIPPVLLSWGRHTFPKREKTKGIPREAKSLRSL